MAKQSFSELINSDTPVLVDFYADWCQPCKIMAPVIEEVAKTYGNKLRVIKINTDNNPQVSNAYHIRGIPHFILFKNGQVIWQASGAVGKPQFEAAIRQYLN